MCGIAGIWQTINSNRNTETMNQMLNSLAHRGPDNKGIWHNESKELVLGHQRLSIIDLSTSAHQPMLSEDMRFAIILNGEIYNYLTLRQELIGCGMQFRSNSDTEVLLKGYEYWGSKVLDKLVGMFAFAIWDAFEENLFMARDRAGEKPLYYCHNQGQFAFASELQAIKCVPGFKANISSEAVSLYLMLSNVPAPLTIFEHVHKLPPAHAMLVSKKDFQIWRYWHALAIIQELTNQYR